VKNLPLISVIMPVYNSEEFLEEAIESILGQTYQNIELIVSYDKSIDSSLDILEKYQEKDPRIILLIGENQGLIRSLNRAIDVSKGKYIARMDADDVSLPNRLEEQSKFLQKNNLDLCGGHCLLIDSTGHIDGMHVVPISHNMCILSMLFKVPFVHPSVMIKKEFLDKNSLRYGQSQFKDAEDFDFWVRAQENGAMFGNLDDIVLRYRVVPNSLSKINKTHVLKDSKYITRKFFKNNRKKVSNMLNSGLPDCLNCEEKSLLVRYVFNDIIRLRFSNLHLIKHISKKIIVNSVLSEILR